MNIHETPQDKEDFKQKAELKKVLYVTNDDGSYTTINSEGWEVEDAATIVAWETVEERLKILKLKVVANELSPIPYFMEKSLFELGVLAKYMGKWKWQIKRHFKPEIFNKLNAKILKKYAQVFDIDLKELTEFNTD